MRVFLSWSGTVSQQVALALRDWLPSVVQAVKPWMSKTDIYKGTRWQQEIASELQKAQFGIVCVTSSNLSAPWLLYEAGALSKQLEFARVAPYVFGMEPAAVDGPLAQWQGTRADKSDTHELIRSLNAALGENGILPLTLDKVFERSWPDLHDALSKVVIESDQQVTKTRKPEDMLGELLELTRNIDRTVASMPSADVWEGLARRALTEGAYGAGSYGLGDYGGPHSALLTSIASTFRPASSALSRALIAWYVTNGYSSQPITGDVQKDWETFLAAASSSPAVRKAIRERTEQDVSGSASKEPDVEGTREPSLDVSNAAPIDGASPTRES